MSQPDGSAAGQEEASAVLSAWSAAFDLEYWCLLARGVGTQVTPYALQVEGGGAICVFTSPQRTYEFGLSVGLPEAEAQQVIGVPTESAVDYLLQFAGDGVTALVLDPGTSDAAVLLAALPHLRELARGQAE